MSDLNINQTELLDLVQGEVKRVFTDIFTKDFSIFAKDFMDKNAGTISEAILCKVIGGNGKVKNEKVESPNSRVSKKPGTVRKTTKNNGLSLEDLEEKIQKARENGKLYNASSGRQIDPKNTRIYGKYEVYADLGIVGEANNPKLIHAKTLLGQLDAKPDPVPVSQGRGRPASPSKNAKDGKKSTQPRVRKNQRKMKINDWGNNVDQETGFIISSSTTSKTIVDGKVVYRANVVVRKEGENGDEVEFTDDEITEELVEQIRECKFHPSKDILDRLEEKMADDEIVDDEIVDDEIDNEDVTQSEYKQYKLLIKENPDLVDDLDTLASQLGMSTSKLETHLLGNLGDLSKKYDDDVSEKVKKVLKAESAESAETRPRRRNRLRK